MPKSTRWTQLSLDHLAVLVATIQDILLDGSHRRVIAFYPHTVTSRQQRFFSKRYILCHTLGVSTALVVWTRGGGRVRAMDTIDSGCGMSRLFFEAVPTC